MVKKIDLNTEITIQNNCHGSFYYETNGGDMAIDLDGYGEDGYVTFGELKKIASKRKKLLENIYVIISYVDSDDITIQDVADALRLTDTYNELASICGEELNTDSIQNWILTCDENDFEKKVTSNKSKLRKSIIETSVYLHRVGKLTNFNKMVAVSKQLGVDFAGSNETSFWSDAKLPDTAIHMIN